MIISAFCRKLPPLQDEKLRIRWKWCYRGKKWICHFWRRYSMRLQEVITKWLIRSDLGTFELKLNKSWFLRGWGGGGAWEKSVKSMKIDDFVGFKQYPDSTGQLSTCRIDWWCQIQDPDWLYQSISTPKYQLYKPSGSITWYQQLQ